MRAATVVLVALLALACVGLSSAFRLGVRMTAGVGAGTRVGAGAAAEAESDPHRLLGRKLEKLRAATETAKNSAKAADEAPLLEYEITDDGISEVKSMATDATPSKTARNSFCTATSASVASVAIGAGAGVSAATEGMVLMALSEHIAPFADAAAVTPALLEGTSSSSSSAPKSSDPAMDRKIAAARKKQKKGTLSCKCTFVPLPNKLPPLKPEQKKTPTGDAAEAKRAAALLKKLTASKKTAAAKPAATATATATPAPTTATTATPAPTAAPAATVTAATPAPAPAPTTTAAAAVSSGTITPLKALLESESQTRATSASMAAAPQFAPMLDTDV